jgi:uncharacterized protein (TIGR02270 family)
MAPLLMDIYEEHLDEAAFRWSQWERALVAPDHDLEETATLEERLLAHLEGLSLGGPTIADVLLTPSLDSAEATVVSASLWALLEEREGLGVKALIAMLRASPQEKLEPLQRALELSGREGLGEALRALLLVGTEAAVQALALGVLEFRGEMLGKEAAGLLAHPDGQVVAAALRHLRFVLGAAAPRDLSRLLVDGRPGVRHAAIEAGMCSGLTSAWEAGRNAVDAREDLGRGPLVLMALRAEARDLRRLAECASREGPRAEALWALGFSGSVEAAEVCLELMRHRPTAAVAGEAFCAITGLRLDEAFVLPPGEEEALPPLEEDLARDLTPRPEDDLPVPDVGAVAAWWKDARGNFASRTRYLRGRVFNRDTLLAELAQGPMRRRHVHALDLAIRSRGEFVIQTRGFSKGQREMMARAGAVRIQLGE